MIKSCENCIHFAVCKFRSNTQDETIGFVDYDNSKSSNWMGRFWQLLAELCYHYKEKKQ